MNIDKLTPQQEIELVKFRNEILSKGRSTDRADRKTSERVITSFYSAIGKNKPMFFWFDGPFSGFLAIELLKELVPKLNQGANLRDNLRANLAANLWDNLWDNLRANLWDNLRANLGANLRDNLWDNLRDNLWANLRDNLWANLGDNLWDNLRANLQANLRANLRDNLRANLAANLGVNLWDNLRANLRDNLRDNLGVNLDNSFWGQHDLAWVAFYVFGGKVAGNAYYKDDSRRIYEWLELNSSIGSWCPFENICFCFERHSLLNADESGRLHSETGQAMAFPDGYSLWAWHGVRVNQHIIESPDSITIGEIEKEANAEVQRVMIERFGIERYIKESGAVEIQRDDFGILREKKLSNGSKILVVQVVNSTAEPDGSFKDYFLPVDEQLRPLPDAEWPLEKQQNWFASQKPQSLTAHAAIASTFGLRAEEYNPEVET